MDWRLGIVLVLIIIIIFLYRKAPDAQSYESLEQELEAEIEKQSAEVEECTGCMARGAELEVEISSLRAELQDARDRLANVVARKYSPEIVGRVVLHGPEINPGCAERRPVQTSTVDCMHTVRMLRRELQERQARVNALRREINNIYYG